MDSVLDLEVLHSCACHARQNSETEACGIVLNFKPKRFFALPNILKSDRSFQITSRINFIKSKVLCVFHSHPLASAYPSDADISCSTRIGIPYLIYSVLYDNFIYFDLKKCIPIKV